MGRGGLWKESGEGERGRGGERELKVGRVEPDKRVGDLLTCCW